MVYLYYVSYFRYTILAGNPRNYYIHIIPKMHKTTLLISKIIPRNPLHPGAAHVNFTATPRCTSTSMSKSNQPITLMPVGTSTRSKMTQRGQSVVPAGTRVYNRKWPDEVNLFRLSLGCLGYVDEWCAVNIGHSQTRVSTPWQYCTHRTVTAPLDHRIYDPMQFSTEAEIVFVASRLVQVALKNSVPYSAKRQLKGQHSGTQTNPDPVQLCWWPHIRERWLNSVLPKFIDSCSYGGASRQSTMMAYSDSDEAFDFLFKIVLIGDAGVGKTCVVQRFKSGTYTEKHGSTIGVDFTMKTLNIEGKLVKVCLL